MTKNEKFLELLGEKYPSVQAATSEIINLEAILRLPKGTEHFVSDLHGEYEAFCHIMNNKSGAIREKVDMLYDKILPENERAKFATLIYYPQQIIEEMKVHGGDNINEWYKTNLYRLVDVCRLVASKYTRSKVRKKLPAYCGYIIEELINVDRTNFNKEEYYNGIFDAIIELGRAEAYIISLATVIKNLVVDHLHIVGDIFDRGEAPEKILDMLCEQESLDIQWGNHDMLWMGAAMGQDACIANVVTISLKYGNADVLESGYGISLRELAFYADRYMSYDKHFDPSITGQKISKDDIELSAKMRKAIFFIMLKKEAQTIKRHPEYNMSPIIDRLDTENGTLEINGTKVQLNSNDFPTIDKNDPYKLTEEEERIFNGLKKSFLSSEKLRRHLDFFFEKGALYNIYNGNLIFHGCIPLDENGNYAKFKVGNVSYYGKSLMDYCEQCVRQAYVAYTAGRTNTYCLDLAWYLWCGELSPLFGKDKMTTFERVYIDDKKWHHEQKNSYYKLCQQKQWCEKLLRDFGIEGEHCHIINGHVPVKEIDGENPIKAEGKLLVIDGGFCKAYHKTTGIAGYTLIYNSHGLELAAHEPFTGIANAIKNCTDIHSRVRVFERISNRMTVAETDNGKEIYSRIDDLKELVAKYRMYECQI